MANRTRTNRNEFHLNDNEQYILDEKFRLSGMKSKSAFLRKLILYGYVYDVDYSFLREYNTELGRISSSLNQIAKRINSTNHVYQEDMDEVCSVIFGQNYPYAIVANLRFKVKDWQRKNGKKTIEGQGYFPMEISSYERQGRMMNFAYVCPDIGSACYSTHDTPELSYPRTTNSFKAALRIASRLWVSNSNSFVNACSPSYYQHLPKRSILLYIHLPKRSTPI